MIKSIITSFLCVAVLTIGVFVSGCCGDSCDFHNGKTNKPKVHISTLGRNLNYEVIIIEGCQYVFMLNGYAGYMAHKGNCNNPIHNYRVEKD